MLAGALVAIVVLTVLAGIVRLLEPRLAFFPLPGETETPRDFGCDHHPAFVEARDGARLRVWMLPSRTPRAVVMYFHGNGANLSVWAPILVGIARHGYSVLAFDYRGYGLSTGRPSERGLYRDTEAFVEWAWRTAAGRRPIVYWGRSLGTAMAAYAATLRSPDGIVLESGFPDVRSLVRSIPPLALIAVFSTYRFPTAEFLQGVRAPVLVMHGDADRVIPIRLGRALYDRLHAPKQFVTLSGTDHNDVEARDARTYWESVDNFIAGLTR